MTSLILIFEYCPGGELFFYLKNIGHFKESAAIFYASNIVLALKYLHENQILYRDLKAENLMVDKKGYIKLTDFGFATRLKDGHNLDKLVGTHEYLAPELLKVKNSYSYASDWWAFGCQLYEMLTNTTPFYGRNNKEILESILRCSPDLTHKNLSFSA